MNELWSDSDICVVLARVGDEAAEGYLDGHDGEFPCGANRSDAYQHGYRNGADDRRGKARAKAFVIRHEYQCLVTGAIVETQGGAVAPTCSATHSLPE